MKKYLLTLAISLCSVSALFAYDGNAPLVEGEEWRWLNMNLVLFAGGFILFLYIVRRLYDARLRMSDKSAASAVKDDVYIPRYWYQCKNCNLTIRKETPPKTAECYKAVNHLWTQLGEVGTNKYLCKNCNTLVNTKEMPVNDNCIQAEFHNWELLQ